jgi:hypothetical protein
LTRPSRAGQSSNSDRDGIDVHVTVALRPFAQVRRDGAVRITDWPAAARNGIDLGAQIKAAGAQFPFHRFCAPGPVLMDATGTYAISTAVDGDARPVYPFVNNGAALDVNGLLGVPAWALSATNSAYMWGPGDIAVWESDRQTFQFEEKLGPGNILLSSWGFAAVGIMRPSGIHAVTYSGS